jgi:hypothetical protein
LAKELGEDVSWIEGSTDVETILHQKQWLHAHGGKQRHCDIYLGNGGWCHCDHTLIIPKHVGLSIQRDPQYSEGVPKVYYLSSGNASSNKFRTVFGRFHCLLTLGEPFNRSLVDKMEDASADPHSSKIMHEV